MTRLNRVMAGPSCGLALSVPLCLCIYLLVNVENCHLLAVIGKLVDASGLCRQNKNNPEQSG